MSKGFTLIELLIVIGILAILATATVLVLNPTELFAQARDSQRLSDLDTMRGAINFYLASVSPTPSLQDATAPAFVCATPLVVGNYGVSVAPAPTNRMPGTPGTIAASSVSEGPRASERRNDGDGWLPVNFVLIQGGAPFAAVPIDPTNDPTYNYQYACNDSAKTFELNAVLESAKYATTQDLDGKDGGNTLTAYEVGTALTF